MLRVASELKGYIIRASDGEIGKVSDVLFDDTNWKTRWLVVDTEKWLPGRPVLLSPSAVSHVDVKQKLLTATVTQQQVKDGPRACDDEPVFRQMEQNLYRYHGWDAAYGPSYFGATSNAMASAFSPPPLIDSPLLPDDAEREPTCAEGDPHLRSIESITGYHMKASDGQIGHVEDFLIDETDWNIRYLIVDTKNWWPAKHVLMSPIAVSEIVWADRQIQVNMSRDKIKASPSWNPLAAIDQAYEKRIHDHYGWPS